VRFLRVATAAAPLLVLVVALARPASAFPLAVSSWRCGPRVVGIGHTTGDVYARCGEPAEIRATTDLVTVRVSRDVAVTRAVPIEVWIYDRGPHQFVRYLTFRDGVLVAIDEGSYGG
jgi:hypothetical protein